MKKIIFLLLVLSLLLIIGCAEEKQAEELMEENETASSPEDDSTAEDEASAPLLLPSGACAPSWKCISSQMKAYQNESCGFERRITCPLGCQNDTCRAASVCTSGFICLGQAGQQRRAYQTEGCTTINEVECPGGCEEGECLFYNETAAQEEAQAVQQAAAEAPPPDTSRMLQIGQQEVVTVGETEHTLSLTILEQNRARFTVDGFRTDWLEENQNVTIRGLKLTIKEIMFQSYDGGKQQVRYTLE